MNQNKIIQIAIAAGLILVGIYAAVQTATLRVDHQIATVVAAFLLSALIFVRRSLPIDLKFIVFIVWGYALGGKGFAYVTPREPLFIGEIVLVIGALGLIYRLTKGARLLPTKLHFAILLWMAVVAIYLLFSFRTYGIFAIRDSAMAYYGLYFFFAFALFQNETSTRAFSKALKFTVLLGVFSGLISSTVLLTLIEMFPLLARGFYPHPDSFIPLIVAGTVYCFLVGVSKRNLVLLCCGILCLLVLLNNKTAGIFSLVVVMGAVTVFAKRLDIMFFAVLGVALAGLVVAVIIATGNTDIEKRLLEADSIQTLSDIGTATGAGNTSTSDWRISWWTVIFEETVEKNPYTGVGMGGDITSTFLEEVMRIDLDSYEGRTYARYPHNILFTVLGRMGFVGLAVFLIPFISITFFTLRFMRHYLVSVDDMENYLIPTVIVLSGLTNSLVQSTYEVPHGAITHWICLGYIASAAYREKRGLYIARPALHTSGRAAPQTTG